MFVTAKHPQANFCSYKTILLTDSCTFAVAKMSEAQFFSGKINFSISTYLLIYTDKKLRCIAEEQTRGFDATSRFCSFNTFGRYTAAKARGTYNEA